MGYGPAGRACTPLVALLVLGVAVSPVAAERPRVYALTGATVVLEPGSTIETGTVVIRDGLIEAVGADVAVPPDAVEIDASGQWIYPGLIDARTTLGIRTEGGERREDEPYDTAYRVPAMLHEAGVRFCISTGGGSFGSSNARNLPYHAAMAAAFGLDREEAVRAVTRYPAEILGVGDDLGTLEAGLRASSGLPPTASALVPEDAAYRLPG